MKLEDAKICNECSEIFETRKPDANCPNCGASRWNWLERLIRNRAPADHVVHAKAMQGDYAGAILAMMPRR
jgi:DNA-directed RNA polymerase subunit RPC12/RpoP